MKLPLVSIIVPCRNEEQFIAACLNSLLSQDYPKDKLEVVVVDGASNDNTRKIVESYRSRHPQVKLVTNQRKTTPISMNLGIKNARGEIITKTDAHTIYPKNYISKCVHYLNKYKADAVGGVAKTFPSGFTLTAKAISLVFGSKFGSGSSFRIGAAEPQEADTAFGICYRKSVFKKIGLFNERLIRSQDMDLNLRLTRSGGKIILAPDIQLVYYPSPNLRIFFQRNIKDGVWAILPMKYGSPLFKIRHLLPLFLIAAIILPAYFSIFIPKLIWVFILTFSLYFIASLYFSLQIAMAEKKIILTPYLMAAFATRHFGYGIGSLFGLIRLAIPEREFKTDDGATERTGN